MASLSKITAFGHAAVRRPRSETPQSAENLLMGTITTAATQWQTKTAAKPVEYYTEGSASLS